MVASVVREQIASFVFVLLRNAEEKDRREQLSRLMDALVADTFDELFVISLLIRLPQLVVDNPDLIQAVSIPQYMLYLFSTRNASTTLCWAVKYSMLQLLDSLFSSSQVAANFIHSSDLKLKNSLMNTVESFFSLVDVDSTHDLGVALILLLLRTAVNGVNSRSPSL